MKKRGRDRLTSGIWGARPEGQGPLAEKLIDRAVTALGAGIASAVNLLDVEAVIIGGGLGVPVSGSPTSSGSARRWRLTCSPTTTRPRSTSPRSATSAARSAPP